MKKDIKTSGFSLAEALITLLIVSIIALASAPVITRKHRAQASMPHGSYACYWNGDALAAKYEENKQVKDGKVVFDEQEGRYGCEFDPPKGAKNFVVTILGGGGGGAGSAVGAVINKYESSNYIREAEAGIYEFLIVGSGGFGGAVKYEGEDKYKPQLRALTSTSGDVVYVPPKVIPAGQIMNIIVGSTSNFGIGLAPSSSVIVYEYNISNPFLFVEARGGTDGQYIEYGIEKYLSGYINNLTLSYYSKDGQDLLTCRKDPAVFESLDSKNINEYKTFAANKVCQISLVKNDTFTWGPQTSSTVKNAVIHKSSKNKKGSLLSVDHQNDRRYNNIEELEQYKEKFGIDFNKRIKGPNNAYYQTQSGQRDFAKETQACSGDNWKTKDYCSDYDNNYGAGGGGMGIYKNTMYADRVPGKSGLVVSKQLKMYAGLGGEAGSFSQTTYQILSNKIVLFPGKGGKGGDYSSNVVKTNNGYLGSDITAGASGEASYIKNSSAVLGGRGASAIYPNNESTFSSLTNEETSMPIGGNGKLAVEPKEGLIGGLGGFNGTNYSINGQTQPVFKNNALLGTVSTITGAGSGGGGGALIISNNSDDYNIDQGNGGQGGSGLIFVQW